MAILDLWDLETLEFTLGAPWSYGAGPNGQARNASAAKTGSYGIRTNGTGETLDIATRHGNKQTLIIGFHYRNLLGLGDALCRINDGASSQVTIGSGADGAIKAWRGNEAGTLLGTSAAAGLLSLNTWAHIEIKVKIDNSTGTVEVRVNGVTALSLSGIDTQATANAYATAITFCGPDGTNTADFDNIVVMDNAGTRNNNFLGEGIMETLYPSAAGTAAQWTPSAGSNYQNVDETGNHDSDTTYNETNTAGQKDLHAASNLSSTGGSVAGAKLTTFARKTDAGTREIAQVVNFGGGESQRATNTLTSSYAAYSEVFETDPGDSQALTPSKVNAAEIGYTAVT